MKDENQGIFSSSKTEGKFARPGDIDPQRDYDRHRVAPRACRGLVSLNMLDNHTMQVCVRQFSSNLEAKERHF